METLVRLDDVGVSLGGKPVLRHISLSLEPGDVVGIAGANGSGKTTLIRTLATLQRHHSGDGHVLGVDLDATDLLPARSRIGMMSHTPALIDQLSLRENLLHVARLAGIDDSKVEQALHIVGLEDASERRADQSSYGMKRRIELAHLLMRKPTLLLLDEAMSGLDEDGIGLVQAVVDSARGRGGAAVLVSHDESLLATYTSNNMVLDLGRLEARQ